PAGPLDEILDRFAAAGVHSDRLFAETWCRDTVRLRPVGRRYLESKLRERGVAAELAAVVVHEIVTDEDQHRHCRAAARKWWRRQRGAADLRALSRGERYLLGRGFPAALAGTVIRETVPDAEEAT
ncbi:RecX family transcriptional regulator, partial [bacterium]|nr:RecX family transcriptional regulator [bacterium]